jgi:hypothetical protein
MNATDTPRFSKVVFAEGRTTRISAETASRDFTAKVVPGEYALEYLNSHHAPLRDGQFPYYVRARVQIECPERVQSTAELGGVCLSAKVVPATTEEHTMRWYAHEVDNEGRDERLEGEFTRCCDGTGWTGNPRERCTDHYDIPSYDFEEVSA